MSLPSGICGGGPVFSVIGRSGNYRTGQRSFLSAANEVAMSGVNLDALNEEQVDALIAGCRALRALRAPYLDDKVKENQTQPAIDPDAVKSTAQAVMPLQTGEPE